MTGPPHPSVTTGPAAGPSWAAPSGRPAYAPAVLKTGDASKAFACQHPSLKILNPEPPAAARAPWSRTGNIWQWPGCRGAPAGPAGDAALGLVPLQHCVGHSCECGGAEGRGLRPGPGKTQITKFLKNLRQNPHRESRRLSKAKSKKGDAREETEASVAGESHHLWGARRDVIRSSLSLEGTATRPHHCTALHTQLLECFLLSLWAHVQGSLPTNWAQPPWHQAGQLPGWRRQQLSGGVPCCVCCTRDVPTTLLSCCCSVAAPQPCWS